MAADARVVDCTITGDGCIIVEFNKDYGYPGVKKVLLRPETLHMLAGVYSDFPDAADTDFPGVPQVDDDKVYEAVEGMGDTGGYERNNGHADGGAADAGGEEE